MRAADNQVILCRFCGYISAEGAAADGRCGGCGAFSGLELVAGDAARRRSRRTRWGFLQHRLVRVGIVLAPLLAIACWLLWEYTGLPPDPPLPSTDIGATGDIGAASDIGDAGIAARSGEWPQARGGVANRAASVAAGAGPDWSASEPAAGPPAAVWRYVAGSPIMAPPAVAGQRAYVTAEDGSVAALDLGSGKVIWKYESGLFATTTPAVSDGLVFVVFRPGVVTALDAATGTAVWSKRLETASLPAPTVADGRLFVAETSSNRLLALDAATGATLWDYRLDDWVVAPPAINDGRVVATANDDKIHILDEATGRLLQIYHASQGRWVRGAPVISDDLLHISSNKGRVWGIDYRGRRYPLERTLLYIRTQLWVWGFTARGPVQQGSVWATQTGGKQPYPPALADVESGSGSIDSIAVVADAAGIVTGLDADSGAIRWESQIDEDIPAAATIAGNMALVGTGGGEVVALSAADGAAAWSMQLDGPITASPIVAGGRLLVASAADGGTLTAAGY